MQRDCFALGMLQYILYITAVECDVDIIAFKLDGDRRIGASDFRIFFEDFEHALLEMEIDRIVVHVAGNRGGFNE